MDAISELKAHADYCAAQVEKLRKSGADAAEYIAMAKEFRLTVKQLADMGELSKQEKENKLDSMRVIFNKKAV